MAAGLGFKTFTTGEVLTAADVNGYLMQGILVFASAAARDAAITSPQEGQFAFLKDTNVTTYYTGSAWANVDTTGMTNPMTTTGDVIYSSSGSTPARLGIGTAGQVLKVNSGATAPEWAVDPTTDVVTTAGDLIYATAADTVTRLGIGTAGQVLKVNSGATAPEWGTVSGGGKVLQVVSATYGTETTSTSTSWADTGLTASITPSAATSKVLVMTFGSYALTKDTDDKVSGGLRLLRGATAIFGSESASGPNEFHVMDQNSGGNRMQLRNWQTFNYLDSPNTTSSTAYKIQFAVTSGSTMLAQYNSNDATIILLEIGA